MYYYQQPQQQQNGGLVRVKDEGEGMSRGYGSYDGYSRDEEMVHEMRRIAQTLPAAEKSRMEQLIMRVEQM